MALGRRTIAEELLKLEKKVAPDLRKIDEHKEGLRALSEESGEGFTEEVEGLGKRGKGENNQMLIVIRNNETWLVCGGRNFADQAMFDDVMGRLMDMWGCPSKIIHGAARGADSMADAWGKQLAVDVIACPADWEKHGKAAGPIRNEDMLMKHKPKRVIAFPGCKGTADMVQRAKNRRGAIDVVEVDLNP